MGKTKYIFLKFLLVRSREFFVLIIGDRYELSLGLFWIFWVWRPSFWMEFSLLDISSLTYNWFSFFWFLVTRNFVNMKPWLGGFSFLEFWRVFLLIFGLELFSFWTEIFTIFTICLMFYFYFYTLRRLGFSFLKTKFTSKFILKYWQMIWLSYSRSNSYHSVCFVVTSPQSPQ